MLLVPDSITALDPYRDHTFNEELKEALGHKEKSLLDFSLPEYFKRHWQISLLPRPKRYFFQVNMTAVESEKERYFQSIRGKGCRICLHERHPVQHTVQIDALYLSLYGH